MKKAIVVVGPESSGTKNMTRLLILAGYQGSSEHYQPYNDLENLKRDMPEHLVVRWSIPHDSEYVNLPGTIKTLSDLGYHVSSLVTTRDWRCMVESQVNAKHVKNPFQAHRQIRKAYEHIFTELNLSKVYYETVSYESLVYAPVETLFNLGKTYGIKFPENHGIINANSKYLEGTHE